MQHSSKALKSKNKIMPQLAFGTLYNCQELKGKIKPIHIWHLIFTIWANKFLHSKGYTVVEYHIQLLRNLNSRF